MNIPIVCPLTIPYAALNSDVSTDVHERALRVVQRAFGKGGIGVLCVEGALENSEMYANLRHLFQKFRVGCVDEVANAMKRAGLGSDVPLKSAKSHIIAVKSTGAASSRSTEPALQTFTATKLVSNAAPQVPVFKDVVSADSIDALAASISHQLDGAGRRLIHTVQKVAALCDSWLGLRAEESLASCCHTGKTRLIHYKSAHEMADRSTSGVVSAVSAVSAPTTATASPAEWQQWHFDYGLLTALTRPAITRDSGATEHVVDDDDIPCGLTVKLPDSDSVVLIHIPPGCVAIQVGEAAQLLSGGRMIATAHAVTRPGAATPDASRQICVVFVQPPWDTVLEPPSRLGWDDTAAYLSPSPSSYSSDSPSSHLYEGRLPTLASRYTPGMTFSDFSRVTTAAYFGKGGLQAQNGAGR